MQRTTLISTDDGESFMLFDLESDPVDSRNLASDMPQLARQYKSTLAQWRASRTAILAGEDY